MALGNPNPIIHFGRLAAQNATGTNNAAEAIGRRGLLVSLVTGANICWANSIDWNLVASLNLYR
jgi:hypothetical protein